MKIQVRGEGGLDDAQVEALRVTCEILCSKAKEAAEGRHGNKVKWFGKNRSPTNDQALTIGLRMMSDYLNIKCTLLTFVRKKTGQIVDKALVADQDYGQVVPNVFSSFQAPANRTFPAQGHTSSGLRVFAMNEIINAIDDNDEVEKINYIYHEVSHKVLGTVDFEYGQDDCEMLARKHPNKAVRNADNWGYFIAGVM